MKRIILVRHAKSDWPANTEDFDRPLAESGFRDARKMSSYLKEQGVSIHQFVTSPALRTVTTCQLFDDIYDIKYEKAEKLYHPSEENFLSVIYDLHDSVDTVALFSHNNGISNFANTFTDQIMHMPTCGVAAFDIECQSWSEFEGANKKLAFFYEPKKLK